MTIERRFAPFGLVAPVVILLVLMILIPEIWALVLSFTDYRIGKPLNFIGINNFSKIFGDSNFWNALARNFLFVVVAVPLQIIVGLAFSLLLAREFTLQRIWVALILAPNAISPAVAAVMWKYLLDFNVGPVNYFLDQLGFGRYMWLSSFSLALPSVILVYIWRTIPFVVLILYPALISFPRELYEAAAIDRASAWQSFRYITMPLLRPALYVALVFRIIISFRVFGEIWTLTRGGPLRATEVLSIYLYVQGFEYWHFGTAAAVGWMILIFTMLAASYQMRSMYKNMFAT